MLKVKFTFTLDFVEVFIIWRFFLFKVKVCVFLMYRLIFLLYLVRIIIMGFFVFVS